MDGSTTSPLGSNALPSWIRDETLFSLASRTHRLWGYPSASTTASILFGHPHGGTHHDLPTRLNVFAQRTAGRLGDGASIGDARTLFAYYRTFLPPDERTQVLDALCGPTVAHLKLRLGLLTSRFRAHHPLKVCESCMREDVQAFGTAYWHLTHQFPGVWVCTRHHELLRESLYKATGVGRFQWHLPEHGVLREWEADHCAAFDQNAGQVIAFAHLISALIEASRYSPLEPAQLTLLYRAKLAERGWVTPAGNLRIDALSESFAHWASALRWIPELHTLSASAGDAAKQLPRLLRPMRSGTHPIWHFVIMAWLYGAPEEILEACRRRDSVQEPSLGDTDRDREAPRGAPRLDALHGLLIHEGLSLSGAASRLGINVATAAAWAARCGITPSRRPKRLHDDVWRDLVSALSTGMDKAQVAER